MERRERETYGSTSVTANLGKQKVDTERSILVVQVGLDLVDLDLEHLGGVPETADHTDTAGVGDRGSDFGAGGDVHPGLENAVIFEVEDRV